MRFHRRFLAALFCACASFAYASEDETDPGFSETLAPIAADHGPAADGAPGAPATETEAAPGPEVVPRAGAEEWVTQPDTRPFELGMPYEMQSDGAFRYVFPLDVPAFRGLEPKLNLNYASLNRPVSLESFLGDGWRLGGLSKIERTSVNGGVPAYVNAEDLFQLDAREMMTCDAGMAYPADYKAQNTSASCDAGGQFVTLHDNFLKITLTGARGDKDTTFTVFRKDGTRLKYETLGAVGGVDLAANDAWYDMVYNRVWLLTEIRDTQTTANVVTIRYLVSDRASGYAYRPWDISYADYKVDFDYDELSNPLAVQIVAAPDYRSRLFYRLSNVTVSHGGAPLRRYVLGGARFNDGHYSLETIRERFPTADAYTTRFENRTNVADYSTASGQFALITKVTDRRGGITNVAYGRSDGSFVSNDQMPGRRQLVREMSQEDGRGNTVNTASFTYADGFYVTSLERSLGFRKVRATLPTIAGESAAPYVESIYDNESYRYNGVLSKITRFVNGEEALRIDYDYATRTSGRGPWKATLSRAMYETWDGGSYVQSITTYAANKFGENTTISAIGYSDAGATDLDPGDTLVTNLTYAPDTAKYIVANPTQVDYRTAGGTLIARNTFAYDGRGNLTEVKGWTGTASETRRVAAFVYDARGNVTTRRGPRSGQDTTYVYGGPASLFRTKETNALGHATTTTWNYGCQLPLTSKDPNALTTTLTYDAECREATRTLPGGHKITTTYENFGAPASQAVRVSQPSAAASGQANVERTYFDGLGRTWRTTRTGAANVAADRINTILSYDARSNLRTRSTPLVGENPSVPNNRRTIFDYDGLDRLTKTTFPGSGGEYETRAYVATENTPLAGGAAIRFRSVRVKDADCYPAAANAPCGETLTVLDGRGRPYRSLEYDRAGTDVGGSGVARATTTWLNPLGWLTKVTDPRGSVWTYAYDSFGNRTQSKDPDLGAWTMAYDASGNLLEQTDAKSQVITFQYDLLDRRTKKVAGGVTFTSGYDTARSGYFNVGQLTRLTDGAQVITYDYARLGGLAKESHTLEDRTYTIETSFAGNGLVSAIKLPTSANGASNASAGSYGYDAGDRPISFGTAVTAIAYDAWDNPTTLRYGNGTVETRSYSATRGWLTAVEVAKGADVRLDTRLTRAASGLITQTNTLNAFGRFNYVYDYAGRVRSSTSFGGKPDYTQDFTYDAAGSMRSKTGVGTYAYPGATAARPHAPTSVAGVAFGYDANGNMTKGLDGKVLTYDVENRVKTAKLGSATTTYAYGADGARLKATAGGATTLTIGPIEVRNFKGTGGETLILYPAPWFRVTGGTTSVLHRDQVASIQAITGGGGGVVKETTYQPFGEARDATGVENPISPSESHGYIGERYDAGPELQFLNARYYDPKLSLFTSADWLDVTLPGVGTNRFAYAGNSPVNTSDPSGNCGDCMAAGFSDLRNGNLSNPFLGLANLFLGSDEILGQGYVDATMSARNAIPQPGIPLPPFPIEDAVDLLNPIPLFSAVNQIAEAAAEALFGQRIGVTYKLRHETLSKYYYGRASGFGTPKSVMMGRFSGHHMRAWGYGEAKLDVATVLPGGLGYRYSHEFRALRGREQLLVDQWPGGVNNYNVGNAINPISPYNRNRENYLGAARELFGNVPITPY